MILMKKDVFDISTFNMLIGMRVDAIAPSRQNPQKTGFDGNKMKFGFTDFRHVLLGAGMLSSRSGGQLPNRSQTHTDDLTAGRTTNAEEEYQIMKLNNSFLLFILLTILLILFILFGQIYRVENVLTTRSTEIQNLRKSFDDYDKILLEEMNVDLKKQEYAKMDDDYIAEWDQTDPRLIDHIRKNYLIAPDYSKPYNLQDEKLDYSLYGASLIVNKTLACS
uniref:Uncharacterized protein n=1 Tax=Romanomermis culicivorax TaxID=13658 RepID=A0A915JVE8_ROMCU